jgi:hypothetical protein
MKSEVDINGKKLDLILQTLIRHRELLSRVERGIGEARRDLSDLKRDIENLISR